MKMLLDTHIFLWLRVAPEKVSEPVLTAFYDVNNEIFLSIASIWEIQIKQQFTNSSHRSSPYLCTG
jgi:PIN domain nuclease of toxin-antitoxin system